MNTVTTTEARIQSTSTVGETAPATELADPNDGTTPEQRARFAAYMAKPKELPKSGVDPVTGRALPITQEELDARWADYMRRLAEIEASDEKDPPGTWLRMAREINEERALEGRGPAFAEHELCE